MSKKSGLTKRQKLIIEMLAAFNADDPITIQAISEKLKLSSRTVLREMPRINEWFEENDFKLVKKPRIGMYVDEDTETRNYIKELVDMDENKPVYSKADRQMIILLELLTINEPLKYFYFTSLFHISDATLSNDLEEVETWLDHYNLTLYRRPGMGIYWEGKEEDYRQAVTMVLRQKLRGHSLKVLFDKEKKLKERMFPNLTQEVLDDTRDIIKNMQGVLDIEYTDHSIRHLSLYLLITQNRVRMGHEIKEEKDVRSITHLPEYQIAKWLGGKLSNFEGHQLSQGEVYNIAMQLLAAKIWKNKSENKIDEESFKVRQLVMRIIAEMEILLEMEFFENAVLIDGLCNHMKPAINRMKQGVFTENQYIDFLEEKYSKVYVATIKACEFLKEELHIKNSEMVIGFCGRLVEQKNINFLLDIFQVMQKKRDNIKLLLVGDGVLRKNFEKKIEEYNLKKKVILVGAVNNVEDYMQAMDCFILPSLFEGFGIVLLEAQAAGLKCFASKYVVPRETNVTGNVTFLDLKDGPECWAECILGEEIKRYDAMQKLKQSPYEIQNTVKLIEKIFK